MLVFLMAVCIIFAIKRKLQVGLSLMKHFLVKSTSKTVQSSAQLLSISIIDIFIPRTRVEPRVT